LLTDQSQQIAANSGLPNAHKASVCLGCHAHYAVDDDYREFKLHSDNLSTWVIGQASVALQFLQLVSERLDNGGLFPELALFHCYLIAI
jgi:hypothetical protein